jgi:hypothetical protein
MIGRALLEGYCLSLAKVGDDDQIAQTTLAMALKLDALF